MVGPRHALAQQPVNVPSHLTDDARSAQSLELAGNWYLAGEKYIAMTSAVGSNAETRILLLVRAAACFDIAGQNRSAACAYGDAACELEKEGIQFRFAGELYNRAAVHWQGAHEYLTAGFYWRRAAQAFANVPETALSGLDNIFPVPGAAGKFTVSAACYTAAGDAFQQSGDEALWACGAYWDAGRAHTVQGVGYHAFVAYRKALTAVARFYKTHNQERLRSFLPLTEQERATKLDPLSVMEQAAYQGNSDHQQRNRGRLANNWGCIQTTRQLIAAYHEFFQAFTDVGNSAEASIYRVAEKEQTRHLMILERSYKRAALYWIWAVISNYGEDLLRWLLTCAGVLLGFSFLYEALGVIKPVSGWFDYFYFSVVTFTTLGYGDVHPVGLAGKALACVEVIFGFVMFGVLLDFIVNRIRRS
ncbi:MAG: potassium channel family protein [Candidatus Acidiferrales bacterium]